MKAILTNEEKRADLDYSDIISFDAKKIEGKSAEVVNKKVMLTSPENIKVHDIAHTFRKMTDKEYESLKHSIMIQGQTTPVWLYRGKLVDGRHRLKALKELGSDKIIYISLPNNLTLEEVKDNIVTTENRRHQTKSQLAIQAYFEWKKNRNDTRQSYALMYGADVSEISRAKKIEEKLGTDVLSEILHNGRVRLPDGKYHSGLRTIINYIRKIEKEVKSKPKIEDTLDGQTKDVIFGLKLLYENGNADGLYEVFKHARELHSKLFED